MYVCMYVWDKNKKKWMIGEGEGKEGTACPQMKNCIRPRMQLLIGAVQIVLIT